MIPTFNLTRVVIKEEVSEQRAAACLLPSREPQEKKNIRIIPRRKHDGLVGFLHFERLFWFPRQKKPREF